MNKISSKQARLLCFALLRLEVHVISFVCKAMTVLTEASII